MISSCVYQGFTIQMTVEKCPWENKELCVAFMDFGESFDNEASACVHADPSISNSLRLMQQ